MRAQVDWMATAALAAVLGVGNVEAKVPDKCDVRVSLKLTPDVPNPRDPVF